MIYNIILAFGLFFGGAEAGVETKSVEVEDSKVTWIGRKVGGSHSGFINLKDGSIQVEDGKLVGGSFTMDMTSITMTTYLVNTKQNLKVTLSQMTFLA